jgi:hypothetical protein
VTPLTQIGITCKLGRPPNKSAVLKLARSDGPTADGAHDARVRQVGFGVDDTVRNEVVEVLMSHISFLLPLYSK